MRKVWPHVPLGILGSLVGVTATATGGASRDFPQRVAGGPAIPWETLP